MEYKVKRMTPPDQRLIQRSLRENYIYDNGDVEVTLSTETNSEEDAFEISLSAKNKHSDILCRIETRVALEQHSTTGHQYPHLQINNFASDEELMKKGTLHVLLLVQSQHELEECCNGFVYNIGKILELIESTFEKRLNLKEYFFNLEPFEELSKYNNKLHELIYRSFKENKLIFEKDEIELVQFKGKKSEPSLDTRDLFKILRILLQLKFLNPVLLHPLLRLVLEDSQIKSQCPNLSLEDCKMKLLSKPQRDLQYYNRNEFIREFNEKI